MDRLEIVLKYNYMVHIYSISKLNITKFNPFDTFTYEL